MDVCEECGSHQVAPRRVEGVEVGECGLCGHVQGDEEEVALVAQRSEAAERGFSPIVYPLVKALESVPTFRVSAASAGRVETGEYPFVFLRLQETGLQDLERLLTSLEMANQGAQRRWVIECALQRGLLFILRPRFWKAIVEINDVDISEARADLKHLAEIVARDQKLGWWRG
jgi:hypothetical protein